MISERQQWAVAWSEIVINSMPRNWIWVALMKTRNPSFQTSKGWRLKPVFPWLLPLVKNAFFMEAKTVNAGTKFIIRDIAQWQMGANTERLLR